jgi:hypothetical protein
LRAAAGPEFTSLLTLLFSLLPTEQNVTKKSNKQADSCITDQTAANTLLHCSARSQRHRGNNNNKKLA